MRRILAAGLAFAAVIVIAFSAYHIMGKDAEPIAVQATTEAPMRETMEALIPETETPMASETPAESAPVAVDVADLDDAEDPQAQENGGDGEGSGAEVDMNQMIQQEAASQQSTERSNGIDVSKYQGKIDWQQVKTAGIDFAMVRVGYRTQKTGILYEDPYARYNLQEAQKAGIQMGAYFFSTAVTEQEALEEAMWVCDFISQYEITYPVAYNCEGFKSSENRQYSLTKEERTGLAQVFLNYIEERGYTPMFYAAKNELSGSVDWDTEELENRYQIWVSQYPAVPYPETAQSSYEGSHQMWQYTSQGTVTGISKPVDVNVAYFAYDETAQAKNPTPPEVVEDSPELGIIFTDTREEVTAKIKTNLRTVPNSSDPETIVFQLQNGETAVRTGVGDNGWSRVEYQGQTLYAVTSYLTTDFSGSQEQQAGPGEVQETEADFSGVIFTEVNETVTAKIETNLRTEPSTRSDDTVAAKLVHGDVAVRTGLGSNGWSRVEYNGQTLYAVTSYLVPAE